MDFHIEADDAAGTSRRLYEMGHRIDHLDPAFRLIATALEREEAGLFASLRGRYVRTGATRASLTQPNANDAIREFHDDEMVFGSAVPYAKYLKRPPILVAAPRRLASEVILGHIVEGFGV